MKFKIAVVLVMFVTTSLLTFSNKYTASCESTGIAIGCGSEAIKCAPESIGCAPEATVTDQAAAEATEDSAGNFPLLRMAITM